MLSFTLQSQMDKTMENLRINSLQIPKVRHPSSWTDANPHEHKIHTRRLAAIMFTDVVGYTTMIEKDEETTLQILAKNRYLQGRMIEQYGGQWIKEMGDGILSSFNTSSDAVECALQIKKAAQKIPGLRLHIGIHFGEVIFIGDDVYGISVNIASRIQDLAGAGQIFVSTAAAGSLPVGRGFQLEFVKRQKLKNVKGSFRVYEIT